MSFRGAEVGRGPGPFIPGITRSVNLRQLPKFITLYRARVRPARRTNYILPHR